jgi:hypothetical protein
MNWPGIEPTIAPYSSLSTCCSYQKAKRSKPGYFPKSNALSEIGERWTGKYFHVVFREFNCRKRTVCVT